LVFLALLGAVGAHAGGSSRWLGAARVSFWGVAAMLATSAVGTLFGHSLM
jgi:VIT1/CCC1 family predicted Fe2+/Mn2+ transporter